MHSIWSPQRSHVSTNSCTNFALSCHSEGSRQDRSGACHCTSCRPLSPHTMPAPQLTQWLQDRQAGVRTSASFRHRLTYDRKLTLTYNQRKEFDSPATAGVLWLDLDHIEQRYLLAACADGSVAAFDVAQPSKGTVGPGERHSPVLQIGRGTSGAHSFSVSAALWYPVDTGLFVTASLDQRVQVWDSNNAVPVAAFELGSRVYCAAMSPLAHAHALVAAGGQDPAVKLCDARSGGFTHNLTGHRQPVWAAAWSPTSQWHLLTGGCDGQVRMWDIRRAGCTAILDQHSSASPAGMALPNPDDQPDAAAEDAQQAAVVPPTATAAAHDGRVTGLLPTPDGLAWLSAGTDSRVRAWSVPDLRNTLVNYPNTANKAGRGRQLAVTEDARFLFHPSGSIIQMFHVPSGRLHRDLKGAHFESVNCCAWNSEQQELYSGGNDQNIMVWSPLHKEQPAEALPEAGGGSIEDEDAWSDGEF